MTLTVTYTCDACGRKSSKAIDIVKCECSHLGITVDQLKEWKILRGTVRIARTNGKTEQVLKDAIKNLNDFETKHQLTGKTVPKLC